MKKIMLFKSFVNEEVKYPPKKNNIDEYDSYDYSFLIDIYDNENLIIDVIESWEGFNDRIYNQDKVEEWKNSINKILYNKT